MSVKISSRSFCKFFIIFCGAFASTSQYATNWDLEAQKFSFGAGVDSVVGIPNATMSVTLGQRATSSVNVSKSITNPAYLFYAASTSPSVATTSPLS